MRARLAVARRRAEPAQRAFDSLHVARSEPPHPTAPSAPSSLRVSGYSGAYAESDVARAANVKATVDPEGRFRGNRDFS